MTHLDLFSGIGGFSLAAKWNGLTTVAFCEIDPYAQQVLTKQFGAVLENTNSHSFEQEAESIKEPWRWTSNSSPILFDDIRTLDGARFRGITLLTAGVPCQPASTAGKRRGAQDDRWLWPEALRILGESSPRWAIFENPCGILTLDGGLEFERLLLAMESHSYSVQPIIIPACAVDAKHRRNRVWIIAYSTSNRRNGRDNLSAGSDSLDEKQTTKTNQSERQGRLSRPGEAGEAFANTKSIREREQADQTNTITDSGDSRQVLGGRSWWQPEPGLGRVAYGVSHRAHRLKGLGNAIVPQVAAQIIAAMIASQSE